MVDGSIDDASTTMAVNAQTLGRDGLCAIFSQLQLHEQCQMGRVCSDWEAASRHLLGVISELPLHQFAATMTDDCLHALLHRCPIITEVNLADCKRITDTGLLALRHCRRLQSLNLSFVSAVSADAIEKVCHATSMRSLDLGGCTQLSELELCTRFGAYLELDEDEDGLSKVQG
eukprot:CAMPEP_0183340554 /NCGR_PEP_ID=MMETSP0164_2-20130417/7068_1 /TAXON_ID=221442 /ORGANISM="Coccolithus pelagicus ssp braarudi, Strain PLY182g" /LENGTH=173 /DNA_ID=CAMNT_0025510713 /DNA_START=15 /DNA_END=536 /DNA_ORIENTATION=+